jgi:transposase-like protein
LVRKFERSEGSATAFCRKHKLSSQSLRRWQRALQQTEPARESAQFLELEVEPQRPEPSRAGVQPAVELVLGGGMVLRIYRGHSQQQ